MEFACDRCHARFFTSEEPVPAHTYRMPCACGNTMTARAGREEAEPPTLAGADLEPVSSPGDDPFLPAHAPPGARTRLAERDPDAPAEETVEDRLTAGYAVDVLVRRARLRGFLGGAAVGALGAAAIAAALALSAAEPVTAVVVPPREPEPAPRDEVGLRPAVRTPPRRGAPPKTPAVAPRPPRPPRHPAAAEAPPAPGPAVRSGIPPAAAEGAGEAVPVRAPAAEAERDPGSGDGR